MNAKAYTTSGPHMKTSPAGLSLIKRHEGMSLLAYPDPVGVWTIGRGHVSARWAFKGSRITEEQADALFLEDVAEAEEVVNGHVSVSADLTQSQFDALVSFTFNVGGGAFKKSTLLRKLNAGDVDGAAAEFGRWVYGTKAGVKVRLPGLVKRRADEAALFLSGSGGETSGVIGEAPAKDRTAPVAAGVGSVAAVVAPILQASSGATPATIATVAACVAIGFLIWRLSRG